MVLKLDSLDQLSNNSTKFEILNEDPTLCNLSTIQRYLNALELRDEITKDENKQMRPKFTQKLRANVLPKIHKQFVKVPSIGPFADNTTLWSQQISNKSSQSSDTK